MHRVYSALLASLLLGCAGSGSLQDDPEPSTPTAPVEVEITTDDGLTLAATYQAAVGANRGPGLLLLHQFQRDRSDFDVLWEDLHAAGYSLLAIDFRSHGQSDEAPVNIQELLSDREQLAADVVAGLDYLDAQNSDVGNELMGIVGLSVGGNMAIVANHNTYGGMASTWGAQAIVTVSARKDRAEDLAGDASLTLRDGLYIAGADETIQAGEATELESITGGDREAMLVAGTSAHGAALIAENEAVRQRIATWFVEVWDL
jgi:pimeloyl-ACP methyl ester carboxylesterase